MQQSVENIVSVFQELPSFFFKFTVIFLSIIHDSHQTRRNFTSSIHELPKL